MIHFIKTHPWTTVIVLASVITSVVKPRIGTAIALGVTIAMIGSDLEDNF